MKCNILYAFIFVGDIALAGYFCKKSIQPIGWDTGRDGGVAAGTVTGPVQAVAGDIGLLDLAAKSGYCIGNGFRERVEFTGFQIHIDIADQFTFNGRLGGLIRVFDWICFRVNGILGE